MGYPERSQFFAHKFVRLLHKAAVASEIGRDAFALLVVIAHTEDAMRYRGAAKFWNSQLIETLGFKKWDQFDTCRRKAIEAGWLSYSCHGKRMAGEYWVTVPDGYETVTDEPIESYPKNGYDCGYKDGYDRGYEVGYEEGMNRGTNRGRSGVRTGDEQGEPSNPIPIPDPEPEEREDCASVPSVQEQQPPLQQIVDSFAATFGGRIRLTDKRKKLIRTRWRDPWWRENWAAAMQHGAQSAFLAGNNDRGWKITLDFFLKPDTATQILEGKYDGHGRASTNADRRDEKNADAFAAVAARIAAESGEDAGIGPALPHQTQFRIL